MAGQSSHLTPNPGSRRWRRLSHAEIAAYDVVPTALAERVWLVRLPALPGEYVGVTLGRFILLEVDPPPDGRSLLVAHELVHVRQWSELGVVGFTLSYIADFVRGLRHLRSWGAAYRNIDAEQEARAISEAWRERRR